MTIEDADGEDLGRPPFEVAVDGQRQSVNGGVSPIAVIRALAGLALLVALAFGLFRISSPPDSSDAALDQAPSDDSTDSADSPTAVDLADLADFMGDRDVTDRDYQASDLYVTPESYYQDLDPILERDISIIQSQLVPEEAMVVQPTEPETESDWLIMALLASLVLSALAIGAVRALLNRFRGQTVGS